MISFCLSIMSIAQTAAAQWFAGSNTMPTTCYGSAVGYYNDSIYLIGGWSDALTIFHPSTQEFTEYDPDFLSGYGLGSYSNWYTQKDNLLYMIGEGGDSVHVVDLSNRQFTPYAHNNVPYGWSPCVAGNDDYLYYLGYDDAGTGNNVKIFSFTDAIWQNGPSMNYARAYFACTATPDNRVYAIGGHNFEVFMGIEDTIEYISTTDIQSNTWILLEETLTEPAWGIHAVVDPYNSIIFTMGEGGVHAIDTLTNTVTLMNRWTRPTIGIVAAFYRGTLYAFGGEDTDIFEVTDTWQYNVLWTFDPTTYPTSGMFLFVSCVRVFA